jgi:predicted aspartyl protease
MNVINRFPLVGLAQGMVLTVGDFYSPTQRLRAILLLDTGSSITTLTLSAMYRLGMDPQNPDERRITHVWGGVHETPILIMPRLRVFGQERCNIEVACGDLPPAIKLDGVLGLNFLQHFDLRINFREAYIELC